MAAPALTTAGGLLAAARQLRPRVAELADQVERERALVPELVAAFRSAGFFHATVPAAIGGVECDPISAAQVVEEIASGDGSAGWCVMIAQQNGGFSGFLDPEHAREIFGNGGILCGTARPIGRAVKRGDGFLVTGRWPFAPGNRKWLLADSKSC